MPDCEDNTKGGARQKDQPSHPAGLEAASPSYTGPEGMAGMVDMAAAKELERGWTWEDWKGDGTISRQRTVARKMNKFYVNAIKEER